MQEVLRQGGGDVCWQRAALKDSSCFGREDGTAMAVMRTVNGTSPASFVVSCFLYVAFFAIRTALVAFMLPTVGLCGVIWVMPYRFALVWFDSW